MDNLLPNQEELQTCVQVLADKVKELQDDATSVSGSRGASAISCRQQSSRTRTLTTVGSLLLILSAQICVFDCMNMMSRVRPRICGLYTTKTCHLQIPNGLTLQRRSDRRCCRQHAESPGNRETPPLMTFLQMPVLVRPRQQQIWTSTRCTSRSGLPTTTSALHCYTSTCHLLLRQGENTK